MTDEISYFDKNLNISYVDESLPTPDDKLILKHCIYSDVLYLLIYIFLCYNPFFKEYLNNDLKWLYMNAFVIYAVVSPIIYLIFRPKSIHRSHSIEIFNYFGRILKNFSVLKSDYKEIINSFVPSYNEKQSLMLIFIKVFFGTLMVRFLYNNIVTIINNITNFKQIFTNASSSVDLNFLVNAVVSNSNSFYHFSIVILFTIDLSVFVVGYLTEMQILKNKIKTVDTNIMGVIFCLMCYPPFNMASTKIIGWYQSDNALLFNDITSPVAWSLRFIAIFFLAIYASASVALGTKASNLTNRGIVSRFPYNIIRHPAYISKNLFWFFTTIPLLFVNFKSPSFHLNQYLIYAGLVLCSWAVWAFVYYFRAIYEERHLMQDPDYQEYVKKVKYRFIPFVI